jgi:hypothetical protein
MKQLLNMVKKNIENDFQLWITDQFMNEKNILYKDFLTIIHDTLIVIDKSIVDIYIFFHFYFTYFLFIVVSSIQ